MQCFSFITRKAGDIPPYSLNTCIYSCILIRMIFRTSAFGKTHVVQTRQEVREFRSNHEDPDAL